MDPSVKKSKVERIANTLEKLLNYKNTKACYNGKSTEYFVTIAEDFTDIDSEKYNLLLFSSACYILYNMKIQDSDFRFVRTDFYKLLSEVKPLFHTSFDITQINNSIFRYINFILINRNINIEQIIV